MQRTILCYGDSNTWGYVPFAINNPHAMMQRYSRHERWPGLLQQLLGHEFYVVEEGLNGRTTNLDYVIPPDRNGKTYLSPSLYTHAPIDIVVLALGGNDFKTCFNRTAKDIHDGLAELVDLIQGTTYGKTFQQAPDILILAPPIPFAAAEKYVDEKGEPLFSGSVEKSKALVELYSELAREKKCAFLDTSLTVLPSEIDGVHYDAGAHGVLAREVCGKILGMVEHGGW